MEQLKRVGGGSVLALLLGSGAALADLSAETVWENWQSFSEAMGQTVTTGAETRSGDRLTITDVAFSAAEAEIEFVGKLDEIVLRELGDGRVEITLSPEYRMSMIGRPSAAPDFTLDLLMRHTDLAMIASGDEDELRYDLSAVGVTLAVTGFDAEDSDATLDGSIALTGLGGHYIASGEDYDTLVSTLHVDRMAIEFAAANGDQPGSFAFSGTMSDIGIISNGTQISSLMTLADDAEGIPEGLSLEGRYTIGRIDYTMSATEPGSVVDAAVTATDSTLDFLLDSTEVRYGVASGNTDMRLSGSDIPFPELAIGLQGSEIGFRMPLAQSDSPQDFGMVMRVIGLTVGEEIWGMFDPGAVLPRDPATLVIDIAGKANWLVNLFDPATMAMAGPVPGEVHELNLTELRLSLGGADLSGDGGFTFDNDDLVTFDGLPRPTGEVNLRLVGANALIDKLIELGFLPQDQAMGARMMLGLFARPGDGEDTLTSKIEVREDGGVYANGQRLQ